MSKKPDTAAALAGILRAKRGDESPLPATTVAAMSAISEPAPIPPPALPVAPPSIEATKVVATVTRVRSGKSSDKANYSQYSVYLRKDTRKKVGRALDDDDTGQDFSELVQKLLEQWLASRT